jgi:hydrogenase maturation factor HypF (carbamoyltransferase family)
MFQSQQYNKDYLYPEEWTDDDKFRFDYLVMESKKLYQRCDEWLIKLAVHNQVLIEREERGIDDIKIPSIEDDENEDKNIISVNN